MTYKVKNFSNKKGDNLQEDMKVWIESMSSIDIGSISVWYDVKHSTHFGMIVYTSYIHQ